MIESGAFESKTMETAIQHHIGRMVDECGINVLVLGCTHYPIIRDKIESEHQDPAEDDLYSVKIYKTV